MVASPTACRNGQVLNLARARCIEAVLAKRGAKPRIIRSLSRRSRGTPWRPGFRRDQGVSFLRLDPPNQIMVFLLGSPSNSPGQQGGPPKKTQKSPTNQGSVPSAPRSHPFRSQCAPQRFRGGVGLAAAARRDPGLRLRLADVLARSARDAARARLLKGIRGPVAQTIPPFCLLQFFFGNGSR